MHSRRGRGLQETARGCEQDGPSHADGPSAAPAEIAPLRARAWPIPERPPALAFSQTKFDYAWHSAALYGHTATGWGEFGFGAIPSEAPFRTPPAVDPGAERIGPVQADGSTYGVDTDLGHLSVDTGAHTGAFVASDPGADVPCASDCYAFSARVKLAAKKVVSVRQRIDFYFDVGDGESFEGGWDDVDISGTLTPIGSGSKRAVTLDAPSVSAVYEWLDDLAGVTVDIEARKQPSITVKPKGNGTQASVELALPFRAAGVKRTRKGTVRIEVLGAYRD